MSMNTAPYPAARTHPRRCHTLLLAAALLAVGTAHAAEPAKPTEAEMAAAASAASAKESGAKIREALGGSILPNKKLTLVINGKTYTPSSGAAAATPPAAAASAAGASSTAAKAPSTATTPASAASAVKAAAPSAHSASAHAAPPVAGQGSAPPAAPSSRSYAQARALALANAVPPAPHAAAATPHGAPAHWSYEGEAGPQAWGQLKPEFNLCAIGKRQSPINIVEDATLQGPAEALQFAYNASNAVVVNNGHTIQVDVQGDNTLTVRGSRYRLVQFHFHTPSEEMINQKRAAMVAHLVHQNDEGQLAVVAVLLEPGASNALIDKVWTYMPLDAGDRVRMPADLLNLTELLPADQRYYQFMGSLTTPPCTEGVLWMVLKQPVPIGKAQYKLFSQLYPNNARPVQPLNGRPVRDAL